MPVGGELGIQTTIVATACPLTVLGRASGPHLALQPQEFLDLAPAPPTARSS